MIKAVIFDYGGVVAGNVNYFYGVDSVGRRIQCDPSIVKAAKVVDFPYETVMINISSDLKKLVKGEIEEQTLWENFAAKMNIKLPQGYENLLAIDLEQIYPENKDVVSFIYSLQKQGMRTGCLSNTTKNQSNIFKMRGRYNKFDPVFLSCNLGAMKPEQRIYQEALDWYKMLGISPQECVYIDDVIDYLTPAANLGMNTINFRSGEHSIEYLHQELRQYLK